MPRSAPAGRARGAPGKRLDAELSGDFVQYSTAIRQQVRGQRRLRDAAMERPVDQRQIVLDHVLRCVLASPVLGGGVAEPLSQRRLGREPAHREPERMIFVEDVDGNAQRLRARSAAVRLPRARVD